MTAAGGKFNYKLLLTATYDPQVRSGKGLVSIVRCRF